MRFYDLLAPFAISEQKGTDTEVEFITSDSREVRPDACFIAVRGSEVDGHRYLKAAIDAGASAVIVEDDKDVPPDLPCAVMANTRMAVGPLASHFYGNPSGKLHVCGITGTNGKTSTTYIAETMLKSAGFQVAVIGTVNYRYGGREYPAPTTTPGPIELQKHMAAMVQAGVSHLLIEVSSHALDQFRVDGCTFDCAMFTNLTRDHLDYHTGMADYAEAKRRLFVPLLEMSPLPERYAIIDIDDAAAETMVQGFGGRIIRLSLDGKTEADIFSSQLSLSLKGTQLTLDIAGKPFEIDSPLIGSHNGRNLMQALAIGLAYGLTPPEAIAGVCSCRAIPGRLECVPEGQDVHVFVDYSHTPDLFGCGGDRDRGKRPQMGKTAGRLSDIAIVTSDNPRTEDPAAILDEIEPGVISSGMKRSETKNPTDTSSGSYLVMVDRAAAIDFAVALARPGDTILIAGKGHEDYQIIGTQKHHFDDREEAARALVARQVKGEAR